jgi:hypothetical protein
MNKATLYKVLSVLRLLQNKVRPESRGNWTVNLQDERWLFILQRVNTFKKERKISVDISVDREGIICGFKG